jgi:hypothetical protein
MYGGLRCRIPPPSGYVHPLCGADATPFFVYFNHSLMHMPVIPREEFKGISGQGDWADSLLELDGDFGALLDLLDELNVTDNIMAVFAGDNGPEEVPGEAPPGTGKAPNSPAVKETSEHRCPVAGTHQGWRGQQRNHAHHRLDHHHRACRWPHRADRSHHRRRQTNSIGSPVNNHFRSVTDLSTGWAQKCTCEMARLQTCPHRPEILYRSDRQTRLAPHHQSGH